MIVFLHGWGMSKTIFSQFVETYLNAEDVLLLDLPGYGKEEWLEDFDSQVAQLLAKIPKDSHLLAWSLAGLYALRMIKLYPDYLSHLTMVSSTPCFAKRDGFSNALDLELLDQFSEQLLQDREATIDRFLLLQLHGQENAKKHARTIKEKILAGPKVKKEVLEYGLKCLKEKDFRSELKASQIPIKFIFGKRDKIVPYKVAEDIRAINPNINIITLAKAAHLPFISHEKLFLKTLLGLEGL